MNKKILKLFLYLLLPIFITIIAVGSVAWFKESGAEGLDTHISQGLVITQYFHCGTGTSTDPYVITRPIHYYHLVELYQRRSGFANNFTYFQLGYDLDPASPGLEVYNYNEFGETDGTSSKVLNMAYYSGTLSLLPIGTDAAPFFGVFDGSGLTIENLNVVSQETITYGNSTRTYNTCDVGVFGYVSGKVNDYVSLVKNTYFNNVSISLVGSAAEANIYSDINVTNTYKHASHDSNKVYVGYIIGHLYNYVPADGIDYTNNTVSVSTTPICDVYMNNVKIVGGNLSPALCRYGYIGYVDNINGDDAESLSQLYESLNTTSVGDEGWGGSIDMTSLYNRIVELGTNDPDTAEAKYVTKETIVNGQSVKDPVLVKADELAELDTDRSDLYYWSALKDMDTGNATGYQDMSGGALYASRTSTWNYLYGLGSTTVQSTTYTKSGADLPAIYIYDASSYLTLNTEGLSLGTSGTPTFTSATSASKATKWIPETSNASSSYYYCFFYNEKYYLNASGTTSITSSKTAATKWYRTAEGEFYMTSGGKNYYLENNGSWVLTPSEERYYITDGTHYLAATTVGIYNVTTADEGAMWSYKNYNNNSNIRNFYFNSNGVSYYLAYNNGLTICSESQATASNSQYNINWYREVDGTKETYYCLLNGIKYYIVYNGTWVCLRTNGSKIHNGNNYLIATTEISNGSESHGTVFQITQEGTSGYVIVADNNGVGTYLSNSGSTLTLSTTKTYWQKDDNGNFYKELSINNSPKTGSERFYLVYNNGWLLSPETGYKIYKDNNYLSVSIDSSNNASIIRSVSSTAQVWQIFGKYIYMYYGNNTYYLGINANGLVVTTTKFEWNITTNGIYGTYNGDYLYITYLNNTWTLTTNESTYLYTTTSDNVNHYLSFKNTAVVASTLTDAVSWQIKNNSDGTIYIYQIDGINKHYLSISNNVLSKVSNPANLNNITKWKQASQGTNAYKVYTTINSIDYYLYYNSESNTWEIVPLKDYVKLQYKYYSNGQTKTIYMNTNGEDITYTTDSSLASTWIIESTSDGVKIYTYVGTQIYYLDYIVDEEREYEIITTIQNQGTPDEQVVQTKNCIGATIKCVPSVRTEYRTHWTFDENGMAATISDVKHYLTFNEFDLDFEFKVKSGYRITDGQGSYLSVIPTPADLNAEKISWTVSLGVRSGNVEEYPIQVVPTTARTFNGNSVLFVLIGDTKYYLIQGNNPKGNMSLTYTTTAPTNIGDKDSNDIYRFFINKDNNNELTVRTFDTNFRVAWISSLNRWEFVPNGYTNISTTVSGQTYYLYHRQNNSKITTDSTYSSYPYFYSTWLKMSVNGTSGGFYLYYGYSGKYGLLNATRVDNRKATISSVGDKSISSIQNDANGTSHSYTIWYMDGSQIYTIFNSVKYYLYFDTNIYSTETQSTTADITSWYARTKEYVQIKYNTYYYVCDVSGTPKLTTVTNASGYYWYKTDASPFGVYAEKNNTKYYLTYSLSSGFGLSTTASSAASLSADSKGFYVSVDNVKYYIIHDYTGWNVDPESYYLYSDIFDPTSKTQTRYYKYNKDSGQFDLYNGTATASNSTHFVLSNTACAGSAHGQTTTIAYFVGGIKRYIVMNSSQNNLSYTTDSNSATVFTKYYDTFKILVYASSEDTRGANYFLLGLNNQLSCTANLFYYIRDTSGHYLTYTSSSNTTQTNDKSSAQYWISTTLGDIFANVTFQTTDGRYLYFSNRSTDYTIHVGSATNYYQFKYDGEDFKCTGDTRYTLTWRSSSFQRRNSDLYTPADVQVVPAFTTTLSSSNGSGSTSLVVNQTDSSLRTNSSSTINEHVYTQYNVAAVYNQTAAGSTGIPDATDLVYYLDTNITTVNSYSTYSQNGPTTVTITYASNISNKSSGTITDKMLLNNIKFDGRSISSLGGTVSFNGKNLIITIPSTYINKNANYFGYTHHTLTLVTKTVCETSVLSTFKLYLVDNSWTTNMPRTYGLVYMNGYFEQISVSSKSTVITFNKVTNSKATYNSNVELAKATVDDFDIVPTKLTIDKQASNPTVTFINTQDKAYVSTTSTDRKATYIPLCFVDEEGNSLPSYAAYYKNTGYIVGGTYSEASGSGKGDIRVSRYGSGNISESYYDGEWDTIYTFNDSGTSPVAINDASNTYVNYASSKEKFKAILDQNEDYVFGLHFMDTTVTKDHTIIAESVLIQNKYYSNYELPESCIDFNVASQGYITLWAGDYYSGNSSFFSLSKVYRDSNNKITNILKIVEVYSKDGLTARDNYVYSLTDGTNTYYTDPKYPNDFSKLTTTLPTGYYSVFKMKWLETPTSGRSFSNDYIYYFEIPCNKGEYALGSVEDSDGGYLLYLDIATNGNQGYTYDEESSISQSSLFTQIDYLSTGKVVNSRLLFEYELNGTTTDENFSISMTYDETNKFYDDRYGVEFTFYTINIVNTASNSLDLTVVLFDDDDDPDNVFTYRYKIIYNGVEYKAGATYDLVTGSYVGSDMYTLTN